MSEQLVFRDVVSRTLMQWTDDGVAFPDDLTISEAHEVADSFGVHPFSDDIETMKRAIRKSARRMSGPTTSEPLHNRARGHAYAMETEA